MSAKPLRLLPPFRKHAGTAAIRPCRAEARSRTPAQGPCQPVLLLESDESVLSSCPCHFEPARVVGLRPLMTPWWFFSHLYWTSASDIRESQDSSLARRSTYLLA
jgi:hypothetical protein